MSRHQRKPCATCGGEKEPGSARQLCDSCRAAARRKRERKPCIICGGEKPPGYKRPECPGCVGRVLVAPEVQQEIIRLYVEERLSTEQIAPLVFVSATSVKRTLRVNGIPRRSRSERLTGRAKHIPQDEIDRTVELYTSGLSALEVGRVMGMSENAVRGRLKRAGVLRSRAERFRLYRRVEVSTGGRQALTERQREALAVLERDGRMTTSQVAAQIDVPVESTRVVLWQLVSMGLVASRHTGPGYGRGCPNLWWRTGLHLVDVAERALAPRVAGKPSAEDALPIGPFRDWLEQWIAEEERKVKHMAVARWAEGSDGTGGLPSVGAVCRALEITERRLYAFRYDQDEIAFQTADRLLTISGRPETIEDLWPHLALEDAA